MQDVPRAWRNEIDRRKPRPARYLVLLALLALALLWPLATFGRPGYIMDSVGYHHGGGKALEFVTRHIPALATDIPGKDVPDRAAKTATEAGPRSVPKDDGVQGVRSIVYSVVAYLFDAPRGTMTLLVIGHALALSYVIMLFARAGGLLRSRAMTATLIGLLAFGTSLAPFVTLATPDVFAGVTILAVVLLALYRDRISLVESLILVLIAGFAVAVHASHVLLGIGMAMLVILLALWTARRGGWRAVGSGPVWALAGIATGLLLVVASSVVGFGEVSVAPKRYPFALARSIEDGPARWYLDKNCATEHYAVCELFPSGFPDRAGYFLWGRQGIAARATAEQMNRIRDEEMLIVQRATAAYPSIQLKSSATNLKDQILAVGIDPGWFHDREIRTPGRLSPVQPPAGMHWHVVLQIAIVIAALAVIALFVSRAPERVRLTVLLVTLGILGNDAICAIVAAPDIRYQNRLLWLLPLMAMLVLRQRNAARKG